MTTSDPEPIEATAPLPDIEKIMLKDPLKCTDQDIDAIIEEMRRGRKAFKMGDPQGGANKKPKSKILEKELGIKPQDLEF